jgi:PIN domain nuclease of toxin-antitoxin system
MRLLLDTHLLLWALSSPEKLTKRPRQRIESSEVYASAASIWEISIKSALGKLEADPNDVLAGVEPAGFSHLTIVAVTLRKSRNFHPFTRTLLIDFSWRKPDSNQ